MDFIDVHSVDLIIQKAQAAQAKSRELRLKSARLVTSSRELAKFVRRVQEGLSVNRRKDSESDDDASHE